MRLVDHGGDPLHAHIVDIDMRIRGIDRDIDAVADALPSRRGTVATIGWSAEVDIGKALAAEIVDPAHLHGQAGRRGQTRRIRGARRSERGRPLAESG